MATISIGPDECVRSFVFILLHGETECHRFITSVQNERNCCLTDVCRGAFHVDAFEVVFEIATVFGLQLKFNRLKLIAIKSKRIEIDCKSNEIYRNRCTSCLFTSMAGIFLAKTIGCVFGRMCDL